MPVGLLGFVVGDSLYFVVLGFPCVAWCFVRKLHLFALCLHSVVVGE